MLIFMVGLLLVKVDFGVVVSLVFLVSFVGKGCLIYFGFWVFDVEFYVFSGKYFLVCFFVLKLIYLCNFKGVDIVKFLE